MANERELGDKVTVEAAAVPVSVISCGLVGSLSAILSVPLRDPAACGAKVTLMVQELPPDRLEPQVFVCWKSLAFDPANVRLVIAIAAVLEFVTVTVLAALTEPTVVDA